MFLWRPQVIEAAININKSVWWRLQTVIKMELMRNESKNLKKKLAILKYQGLGWRIKILWQDPKIDGV